MRKIIGISALAIVALIVLFLIGCAWFAAAWGFSSAAAVLPLAIIALVPCMILVIARRELMK